MEESQIDTIYKVLDKVEIDFLKNIEKNDATSQEIVRQFNEMLGISEQEFQEQIDEFREFNSGGFKH